MFGSDKMQGSSGCEIRNGRKKMERVCYRVSVPREIGKRIWWEMLRCMNTVNSRKAGRFRRESVCLEWGGVSAMGSSSQVDLEFARRSKWVAFMELDTGRRHKFQKLPTRDHSKLMRLVMKYGKPVKQ